MTPLMDMLPDHLKSDLERIASAVRTAYDGEPQTDVIGPILDGWLLDSEQREALAARPRDVFFLLGAACLCGTGASLPGPLLTDTQAEAGVRAAYDRLQNYIQANWRSLGITDVAQAEIFASVCRSVGADWTGDPPPSNASLPGIANTPVRLPLLAAAVRLAVDLDLKSPTTLTAIAGLLPPGEVLSPEAVGEYFSVERVGRHPVFSGTIQARIRCRHPEVHRALKHYESAVQRLLQGINRSASPRFLFSDVIFEITADGYEPVDLKFSVDASAALQLFAGNRLYSDNRVFLRELIQNAVDACNLRKLREGDYTPGIEINFNEDISVITIRDNGIGMDRQWIEKYFLKVGISLYQSGELRSGGDASAIGLSFISQFGIGFLSSFLVAEKIVVRTRKAGADGLVITISGLRDYFDVRRQAPGGSVGTEVILHLRPSRINYCRSLEYVGYLKTQIRFVSIPVRLRDEQGNTTTIGHEPLAYSPSGGDGVDFMAPLAFSDSEGYLFLRAKRHSDHIYALDSSKGGISLFQDGIFVTQLDTLLPEGARQHVVGRINLLGAERCALSMDRNRIFWTDGQLAGLRKAVTHGLVTVANRLMETLTRQDAPDTTQRSIVNHLSVFFDFNQVDDAIHSRLCSPVRQVVEKRFRDFVRIHFRHTRRTDGIPEADGYGEAWQQDILASVSRR